MFMEEMYELKTNDTSYSRAVNLKYQGVSVFEDKTQKPMHGEYQTGEEILRFKDGLLHGGTDTDGIDMPAYENQDGCSEFFCNGLLHRDNAPAVIRDFGTWEEWWFQGNLLEIRATVKIEKQIAE